MLIDTREPPPSDDGLPAWEPNWALWVRVFLAVGLGWAATQADGALGYVLILTAFAAACSALDTLFSYWGGLTEWRQ